MPARFACRRARALVFELHWTLLAELMPWAGGGSMETLFARDYHYGPGAKGTFELRGHFSDRVTLQLVSRQYWISGAYATGESEDITWGKLAATFRLYGPHAVTGQATWARRHGNYSYNPDISQRATVWSASYTFLQGW